MQSLKNLPTTKVSLFLLLGIVSSFLLIGCLSDAIDDISKERDDVIFLKTNSKEGEVSSPSINVGSSSRISVYKNKTYEITATAKTGYIFDYWGFSNLNSKSSVTVEFGDTKTKRTTFKVIGLDSNDGIFSGEITAHFKKKPVASTEIVIKIKTTECGTVTPKEKTLSKPASGGPDHVFDISVDLEKSCEHKKWTTEGEKCRVDDRTKENTKLNVGTDCIVTANTKKRTAYLIEVLPSEGGTVTALDTAYSGLWEDILATPNKKYLFEKWEAKGATSRSLEIKDRTKSATSIQTISNFTLKAIFTKIEIPPTVVAQNDTTIRVDTDITLTAVGDDQDGTVEKFHWYINGTAVDTTTTGSWKHSFSNMGTHIVAVKTEDDDGLFSELDTIKVIAVLLFITDSRDSKTYSAIKLKDLIVMRENMNFKTNASYCYDDDDKNCDNGYGRLYAWEESKTVCPTDWHLPTTDEWKLMATYAGTEISNNLRDPAFENGGNTTGFSALAGGMMSSSTGSPKYTDRGGFAFWWTATQVVDKVQEVRLNKSDIFYRQFKLSTPEAKYMSVRCIKD